MGDTSIQWTLKTWNPTRGCLRVSPGCGGGCVPNAGDLKGGCYAERQAYRFSGPGQPYEGLVTIGRNGPRWTGKGRLVPEILELPLRWRKPTRIFVDSMSDLFFDAFTNEEIAAVFGVMAAAPQHTFQVLTKRAERMRAWFAWVAEHRGYWHGAAGKIFEAFGTIDSGLADRAWSECVQHSRAIHGHAKSLGDSACVVSWPLPNVHLGVSVENQQYADERIAHLLRVPAAVRFLSVEPQLGPVTIFDNSGHAIQTPIGEVLPAGGIGWVIQGGESGPGARLFDLDWARSLRDECIEAGVPYFFKQKGLRYRDGGHHVTAVRGDMKGGDLEGIPEDLRIRQFPSEVTS